MASIILIATGMSNDEAQKRASKYQDLQTTDLTVISGSNDKDLAGSINEAAAAAQSESILLIDSTRQHAAEEISKLLSAASSLGDSDIAFLGGDQDAISGLDAESLLNIVVARDSLGISALACKKSLLISAASTSAESFGEISMKLAAKAISAGGALNVIAAEDSDSKDELSNASYAASLDYLVNTFTIEELFPQHAWKEHSQESAAAAYHTLAAYFLRFEDYANATESLRLSDQFEESPRSLALRALIAFNKGETLGAVANLVSSLQQYEERKKSTAHYVKFNPKDLELINASLVSGLEALNKRDNEKALDYFAKAVFSFDGFYAQHGLDSILH